MSKFVTSQNPECACTSDECKNENGCVVLKLHFPIGTVADATALRDRIVFEANTLYRALVVQQLGACSPATFDAVTKAGAEAAQSSLPDFKGV